MYKRQEFEETKILAAWTHGPGVLHTTSPVSSLEDISGLELRGPTRLATQTLAALGATPVGMPLPAIPENLSKGVIDGAVVPWEITPAIRLQELAGNHLEIGGDPALYTATFVLAMNWDAYEALPDDLRAILDENSGKGLAAMTGAMLVERDKSGRAFYEDNNIMKLSDEEAARWEAAAKPVYDRWIERANDKGFDGAATIDKARALISANQ